MAKAIARGLNRHSSHSLSASSPSLTVGINKDHIRTHHDNKEIVSNAEVIILAVKPVNMSHVIKEISPFLANHCLLISVAAGLSLSWFSRQCRADQAVIRTMPNTPASIGLAATPMIANQYTSARQKKQAEVIFSKIGITTWAKNEDDMDTFTSLSGSGPAYVYSFLDALIKAARQLGLDETIARKFALQTVQGALQLAQNDELSLSELRRRVTSPGGTTAAALDVLDKQLDSLLLAAMMAAKKRSKELGSLGT